MARFFVLFLGLLLGLFAAELTPPVQSALVLPWTEALARVSAALVTLFDSRVAAAGKVLQSTTSGFAVSIEAGCNGIEAAIILIAAMLAFPAPWKHRLIGILAGLTAVQALNVARVISLFYIGQWNLRVFEWAHLYVWQALIMLDVLVVWLVWIRTLPLPAAARAGSGMTRGTPSLARFVLATVLWLPPCFAVWYLAAGPHAGMAAGVARFIVELFTAGVVTAVERHGLDLVFVTRLVVPGQAGLITTEVNPLIYTYGLALFLALMLAARARMEDLVFGAAVLLLFQGWGIAFGFLVQVAVTLGPDVALQAGLEGWRREAIVLGYQLGSLVLPSVVPVVLWAVLNRTYIASLLRRADPGPALPAM